MRGKTWYSDHDVVDAGKFPEFCNRYTLTSIGTGPFGDPILQPKPWAVGLANTGILNLLEIPHFGRGKEVNNCVKQLMAVLHGGFLWLEEPCLNRRGTNCIHHRSSIYGRESVQYLDDKTKEKSLAEEMKKTYGTERGSCGIIIKRISDATMRMATKLMACKMLRKCRKEEVPVGVVAAATQCANGTMLSWAPYLLNLFLDDCKDVQDLGTKFHYSWLLILIALIGWREPPYSHFCDG
jgi:hypothetical protein